MARTSRPVSGRRNPKPRASSSRPHLLGLPIELRSRIYELTLFDVHVKSVFQGKLAEAAKQPALTRVGRQIRSDTLPIYYGINIFHFEIDEEDREITYADCIGWMIHNVRYLKHIELAFRNTHGYYTFEVDGVGKNRLVHNPTFLARNHQTEYESRAQKGRVMLRDVTKKHGKGRDVRIEDFLELIEILSGVTEQ